MDSHPVGLLVVPKPEGVTSWLKVSTGRSYYLALANNGELFELVELTLTLRTNSLPALEIVPRKLARPEGVPRWVDCSSRSHGLALGDNRELYYVSPTAAPPLVARPDGVTYWKSFSAGYDLSAAIGSDDRVYVWHPWDSQLVPVSFPQAVRKWISVAAGPGGRALMIGDDCRLYRIWEYYPPVQVKNLEHLCVPAVPETAPGLLTLAPLHPLFQREREFRFHVLGNAAEPFVLFRSPDLKNWMPLFTNAPLAGWRALSDTNVGNATSFFYRVAPP